MQWGTQGEVAVQLRAAAPSTAPARGASRAALLDQRKKEVKDRGNSTKIPSPRMGPAEGPTDPGRRN